MVYTGVKCDNFRCDKLSDKVIAELIVAAVPFFVAVFIARQILRNCEWRWSRIKNFVEDLDMDPLNNWLAILCLRPFYTYLLKILVIMPIPCLLFWTGLTASLIDQYYLYPSYPRLIGGTILTFGTNIAIGGFGFCRWRADRFRLTKLTAFCLLIALGALILLQFGLMYLILNDTRTEYVIYMTYSMGPMMLCFYLNRHIMDNVSFEVFLRMKPSDKSYEGKKKFMKRLCGVLMLGAYCLTVAIHNAFAVGVQTKRSSSEGYHLAAGILFCDTIHSMHNFANLDTNPRLLMFQSFACRVLLYALWTDRWFIAMSVNFLLLAWLLVWHVIDQRNPRLTQEEAFERQVGSLEAMVEREKMRDLAGLPKEKKIDEKESKKAAMLAALGNNPAAQAAAAAAQAAQEAAELAYAALHSPEFSLLTCGSVYVLYVAVSFVGVQSPPPDWAASIFPNMQVGSDLYEQWKIGLVTLTLFIASAMLFFSMRYYENELWKMSGRVASVNAVFVVVTIVGAQLLGWTLHSDYIQLFGIYVPLIIVFTVYTYTQWRSKDYEFNGWQTVFSKRWDQNSRKWNKTDDGKAYLAYLQKIKDRINEEAARKEAIEKRELEDAEKDELTLLAEEKDPSLNPRPSAIPIDIPPPIPHPLGPRSGGDWGMWLLPAAKDFFRPWRSIPEGNQFVSDYLVAVGVALDVLSLLALSIHFGTYTDPEISALVAEFIAIFLLIIFFLIKWFNTYQISNGTTFIILVAACHSAYKMHKLGVAADIVVGYLALGSCAVLLIMAFSSWKASGYKITEYEGKVFFGSAIVIIFFTVLYMSTGSLQAGVVALMVLLVAYMLLYAAVYWANSDFVMPPKIKKVLYAVGVILVIIAAAAVSYLQLDWFYVITIIFVMFLIPTSINTGVGLYESPTFRIMPSRFIFPVFSYSPGLAQPKIKEDLTGTINLFMIAALCIVWGLAAGLLIQPAVVGWIVFCFGLIIAFGGLLDFYFDSAAKFWKNWEIVKDYETIVEDIRQKAIRLVQDQEEKPTSKKLKGKQAAAQPEADDDDEDPEGAPGDEPPEDPVALALWEAEQDIKRVQTLFRNTKRYWDWEQHADLDRTIMNRYKYKKNPTNYDGRWKGAFKFVKKRPNRELATKPYTPDELARIEASDQWFERAYIIEQYLYKLDCNINDKFAQQCKIQVMFQLLLSMTADAIAKKNRVRVKDFIRRLVETNMLHKSIENYSAPQVMSWGAKKDVQRMLKLQAEVYVDETIERMKKEGSQADADRMKAAARKNAVAGAAGGTAKASGEGAKIERSKLAIARDYTYIAPKAKIINDKNSPDNGLPEVCGLDPWYKMYVKKTQKDPSYKRSKPSDPEVRYIYPKGNKFIDDYQSLQIVGEKGETAESVTMKAREALKLFIAKWGENPKSAFIDIHFPDMINVDNMIENGADGDDTNTMPGTAAIWQRPKEFLKTKTNPFVFETDAIDPTCLLQGSIETCYLLSAVSVLAKKFPADRFKDMFITREFNEFGIYGMTLFDDGKWKAVWVDDQFLIKAKKGKPELVFARSKRPTELWVPLLEKCYAKLYRGYPLISGGLVHEAFKDFTGGATDEVDMRDPDAGVYDGRLWKKLLTYQKEGYLVGCGNPKPEGSHSENQGIIDGHAYSVLDIREAEGVKLLKLRNPWGDSEFTGDWSDVSSNWNARFRKLFDHFNDDPNDGVFWIGFEDFAVLFQKIYVCRLFDDVADVTNVDEATQKPIPPKPKPGQRAEDFSPYFRQIIDAEWKIADKTAAGSPAFLKDGYEPERNPQWTIELDSEAPPVMAFVSISQATQLDKKQYKNMALLALDRDGKRVRQLKKSQVVAGAVKFINNREISIEVPLTPGKKITIFPCTFKKDEETTFSLTIYCREAFKVEQLTSDTPFDD